MASKGFPVEFAISILNLYKHNGLSVSSLQNQTARVTGWPDALAEEKRSLLCAVRPSGLQGKRIHEFVSCGPHVYSIRKRPTWRHVTPAQEDHGAGWGGVTQGEARGIESIIPKKWSYSHMDPARKPLKNLHKYEWLKISMHQAQKTVIFYDYWSRKRIFHLSPDFWSTEVLQWSLKKEPITLGR